ncbi:BMP family lipoprotein [Microbacterium sp. 179-I 3D3 NHS]|uniref:BMP family lipoprotein n=1 Tax=unclassified Microbacterium TaxID=2609290 RepID=UPI0039A0B7C4
MTTVRSRLRVSAVAVAAAAVVLAGCATPPPPGSAAGPGSGDGFRPCLVGDAGGFDDKSFNQAGYEGVTEAAAELKVEAITVESTSDADYTPNVQSLLSQGCDIIVSAGYLLADATRAAAEASPDTMFAISDDNSIDLPNVKPIVFETSEAAFLAGYAAASHSKSGVVGTYGGMQIPSVTIFMDGFAEGVDHYNQEKSASVEVVGWNVEAQTGSFTGGFAAGVESKTAAQGLIDQGADVIMAVGGPIFLSAGEAIRDAGKDIALVGVDSDNYETATELKDLFLTSVLKGVKVGVAEAVTAADDGTFSNEPFVGTLENGGVGIAPFHDFADDVDPELQNELDAITQAIIDGDIVVESPSSLLD